MDKIAFFYNLGYQIIKEAAVNMPIKEQLGALWTVLADPAFKGRRLSFLKDVFWAANPEVKAIALGIPAAGLGILGAGGYGAYKALKPKSKKEKILSALGLD